MAGAHARASVVSPDGSTTHTPAHTVDTYVNSHNDHDAISVRLRKHSKTASAYIAAKTRAGLYTLCTREDIRR